MTRGARNFVIKFLINFAINFVKATVAVTSLTIPAATTLIAAEPPKPTTLTTAESPKATTSPARRLSPGRPPSHAFSLLAPAKLPANFHHFPYVNPDAPKGGTIHMYDFTPFNNLNVFAGVGLQQGLFQIYDSLMVASNAEAAVFYCLLCKTVEVARDWSWVQFELRPEARWHDGQLLTADDVIFTFDTHRNRNGASGASSAKPINPLDDIRDIEKIGEKSVRFVLKGPNRDLIGELVRFSILPKHSWKDRKHLIYERGTGIPLGSGPYEIVHVDPGHMVAYQRVKDYWGADLPVNRGQYNFDSLEYAYYGDQAAIFKAFKAHQIEYFREGSPKQWSLGYDFAAVKQGLIKREEVPLSADLGMNGMAFNLRRKRFFEDRRVRQALTLAFNFENMNKQVFHSAYSRVRSYYQNLETEAKGIPDESEVAILKSVGADHTSVANVPPELWTQQYNNPVGPGDTEARTERQSGNLRPQLQQAAQLLKEAGWQLDANQDLRHNGDGELFEIDFPIKDRVEYAMLANFQADLKKLGIHCNVHLVDSAEFRGRLDSFNFDMTFVGFGTGIPPGNELFGFFSSLAADQKGSGNLPGIKNPIVDALIEKIVHFDNVDELKVAARALDRVLIWNHYIIPGWGFPKAQIAYWNDIAKTDYQPINWMTFPKGWWWAGPKK
ncbi:MAG: hypothetical protein C5B49_10750 [Bdellovibrio sp.]|nr:MAG: hypothetical protein C5B49_10750 [Bdellovibrio sp.]